MLKAMSLVLTAGVEPYLSKNRHHLKGHGGVKAAVQAVAPGLAETVLFSVQMKPYLSKRCQKLL